jgi:hypothetical protein
MKPRSSEFFEIAGTASSLIMIDFPNTQNLPSGED